MVLATQVSAGLVKKGKKLLMVFDEETESYALPSEKTASGELSAETAERAVENLADCSCETARYHESLKIEFSKDGEDFKMQSFTVEIDEEPQKGEWVHKDDLGKKELASPLEEIHDKISSKV